MTKLFINGEEVTPEYLHYDFVNDKIVINAEIAVGTPPSEQDDSPDQDDPSNEDNKSDEGYKPPEGVEMVYPIKDWPHERDNRLTVPKGKILVSEFTTTSEDKSGAIYYQFDDTAGYDTWISEEPNGEPVSQYADVEDQSGISMQIEWRQGSGFSWYAELEKNKTYYLHLRHSDPEQEQTTLLRMVQ